MALGFREYLELLEERGALRAIETSIDPKYEISAHLYLNGPGPALRFEDVAGSEMRVVGNLLCYHLRGDSFIDWTHQGLHIYAYAFKSGIDDNGLYDWWTKGIVVP